MAITCPNHPDQDAAVGVMVYGPEGSTIDLCGTCLLEWAVTIVEGAGARVIPPGEQGPETAATAADGGSGTRGRRQRRRGQEEAPAPATAAEVEGDQDAALSGAEHDGGNPDLEPGPAAEAVRVAPRGFDRWAGEGLGLVDDR